MPREFPVGDLSYFLPSSWVSSLLHNQPRAPSYWSHLQGGASETTLDTLLSTPQVWLGSWRSPARGDSSIGCNSCAFLRHWVLAKLLTSLVKKREARWESMLVWDGRRHPFSVATEGWIQCYLGLWREGNEVKQWMKKYLAAKDFLSKSWGSQRDLNWENGMKIQEVLCLKGKWGWRETVRKTEKEEKMNNTRFLMSNLFRVTHLFSSYSCLINHWRSAVRDCNTFKGRFSN